MVLLAIVIVLAIIFSFICGWHLALHKKAKKMIEECDFGDIILDMKSPENDLVNCEFTRNPKEMLGMNYILLQVKIRK